MIKAKNRSEGGLVVGWKGKRRRADNCQLRREEDPKVEDLKGQRRRAKTLKPKGGERTRWFGMKKVGSLRRRRD